MIIVYYYILDENEDKQNSFISPNMVTKNFKVVDNNIILNVIDIDYVSYKDGFKNKSEWLKDPYIKNMQRQLKLYKLKNNGLY